MRRKYIVFALLLCLVTTLVCAVGCNKQAKSNEFNIVFNQNRIAEIGKEYTPEISVTNGAEIKDVVLVDVNGNVIKVSETYSFTPNSFGIYYYKVNAYLGTNAKSIDFAVEVKDSVPPVILEKPTTTKDVELGIYDGFSEDLEKIKVDDNNSSMKDYITKKVVAISSQTETEESDTGFVQYFFKAVGEYVIKVEIKDLAQNVSYVEYVLNVKDSVAPFIDAHELYYGWVDSNGKVQIPSVEVNDLSQVSLSATAKLNGNSANIVDGKLSASVGDVFEIKFTAKDSSDNLAEKLTTLKVLEYGQLFDKEDENIADLFVAENGIIEYDNGLAYFNDGNNDEFGYKEGAYSFGDLTNFKGIALKLKNYGYNEISVTLKALVGQEKIAIGSVTVKGKTDSIEESYHAIDFTKANLNSVNGWCFELTSNDSISITVEELYYIAFEDSFVTVDVNDNYALGDKLNYKLDTNGHELYDVEVEIKKDGQRKGLLTGNEEYVFTETGNYTIDFTVDVACKKFVVTKTLSVSNGNIITFDKPFDGGRVGQEYVLPMQSTGEVSVKNAQGGTINVVNGRFTPDICGDYTVTYSIAGEEKTTYTIYVAQINEISFETQEERIIKSSENGGLNVENTYYASTGKYAAKAIIAGGQRAGITFEKDLLLSGQANFVKASVRANLDGIFKMGFVFNSGDSVMTSSDIELTRGENEVEFLLDADILSKLNNGTVSGLYLYNQSIYKNVFYVDSITFENKTVVEENEIFEQDDISVYAERGGQVVIPDVLKCDVRLLDSVVVEILDVSGNVIETAGIGGIITLNDYALGVYTLKYKVVVNQTEEFDYEIDLNVVQKVLTAEIDSKTYYTERNFNLPDVQLSSEVLTEEELANAVVNKYYRMANGTRWINADGEVYFGNTGNVNLKYTISLGQEKIVAFDNVYVHEKGVHLDFETWERGDHLGFKLGYGLDPLVHTTLADMPSVISNEWSYDGTYSMKVVAHTGYTNVSGAIAALQADEPLEIGFTADTVVFWAYSEGDRSNSILSVDNYDWNWSKANLQIKKGVHKYVLPLSQPISSFKRFVFELGRNESFYIDNVSFVNGANVSFPKIDGKQFDRISAIEIDKPKLVSASEIAFDELQINNAEYSVEIFDGGKTITKMFAKDTDKMTLDLNKGEYEITYVVKIGDYEIRSNANKVTVRNFKCEFVEPKTLYQCGVEYKLDLPISSDEGIIYKVYSRIMDGEWKELVIVDGKAILTLDKDGNYELKFTAVKGEYTEEEIYRVLVRPENSVVDFEINEDGSHVTDGGIISEKHGYISDKWSYDGNYSFRVSTGGHDYAFVYFMDYDYYHETGKPLGQKDLNTKSNAITMWINADKAISNFKMDVFVTPIGESKPCRLYSQTVDIQKGVHMYTFNFEKAFEVIYGFGFEVHYANCNNFYIDGVRNYFIDVDQPDLPKTVTEGTTITFDKLTANIGDKEIPVTVSYKVNDGEYVKLDLINGKYEIKATEVGTLSIQVVARDDGNEIVYNYSITVYEKPDDPFVGDVTWQENLG